MSLYSNNTTSTTAAAAISVLDCGSQRTLWGTLIAIFTLVFIGVCIFDGYYTIKLAPAAHREEKKKCWWRWWMK